MRTELIERFGSVVEVADGSIVDVEAIDAIVSPDDNHLTHGGEASAAIWKAAGRDFAMLVSMDRPAKLALGDVLRTGAGVLRAEHVFHAITVDLDANRAARSRELRQLYESVLEQAAEYELRSVAFPLLGTGVGAEQVSVSAGALADALIEQLRIPRSSAQLERVVVLALGTAFDPCVATIRQKFASASWTIAAAGSLEATSDDRSVLPVALTEALQGAVRAGLAAASQAQRAGCLLTDPLGRVGAVVEQGRVRLCEDFRQAAPPRLLEIAVALHEASGKQLDRGLVTAAEQAIVARNAVLHASGETVGEEGRTIRDAVALLSSLTAGRERAPAPDGPLPGAERKPSRATAPAPQGRPAVGAKHKAKPAIARQVRPRGTDSVLALNRFLKETLDPDALQDLQRKLAAEGYEGSEDNRLLEFCVRVANPLHFVASEISAARLRRELKARTNEDVDPGCSATAVAAKLLDYFGFPIHTAPRGLQNVLSVLERSRTRVEVAGDAEIKGLVTGAAAQLEYVFQLQIRFICQAMYREPPDTVLARMGLFESGFKLERCSLGKLVPMCEKLGADLEESTDPFVCELRKDFGGAPLVPGRTKELPALRNQFAHFERSLETRNIDEARIAARAFFAGAREVIEQLASPRCRVFPRVILVKREVIDEWGRRTFEAEADDGASEVLFTKQDLSPGEVYLMHPVSNPLRVEPILVRLGDASSKAPQASE